MCYDALVAPLVFRLQPPAAASGAGMGAPGQHPQQHCLQAHPAEPAERTATPAAVAAAATELLQTAAAAGSDDAPTAAGAARQGLRLKLLRMAVAAAAVVLYVRARSWLAGDQVRRQLSPASWPPTSGCLPPAVATQLPAGACLIRKTCQCLPARHTAVAPSSLPQCSPPILAPPLSLLQPTLVASLHFCFLFASLQLVRIYRRVENPIPFAQSSLVRKLTTGYLHSRYAGLLVAPLQLSGGPACLTDTACLLFYCLISPSGFLSVPGSWHAACPPPPPPWPAPPCPSLPRPALPCPALPCSRLVICLHRVCEQPIRPPQPRHRGPLRAAAVGGAVGAPLGGAAGVGGQDSSGECAEGAWQRACTCVCSL